MPHSKHLLSLGVLVCITSYSKIKKHSMYSIAKIWKPTIFQGHNRKSNYFEGWYFKLVDDQESQKLAIIPGISYPKEGEPHVFIQVLDAQNCKSEYHRFPVTDFQASKTIFEVKIGNNYFSADKIVLDLPNLKGELHFTDLTPWDWKWYSPGIMGPFSFLPFMECYHGVVSLHHHISGKLILNGKEITYKKGIGYIEKDWGRSFPSSWIWMQSNHFEEENVSLSASVAMIPYKGISFIGFIVGFWWRGKLYRFTTYNGGKLEHVSLDNEMIHYTIRNREYRLEIKGYHSEGGDLVAPINGKMEGKLKETIMSRANITLSTLDGKVLFSDVARNMGLEAGGKVEELLL